MEFFQQANQNITSLNENEKKIFEYVVRNIHQVQQMQIRTLAERCFVSTTTIVRFTKKLGFSGYRDFIQALGVTCHMTEHTQVPDILWKKEYSEEYLKNIIESVRVISPDKIGRFLKALDAGAGIYFFGTGMDREAAHYAYRMFSALGNRAVCPQEEYEAASALTQLKDGDVLFIFSLSGRDEACIRFIEKARLVCRPVVAAITQSANNPIQGMSDIDFYVFADQITYKNADLTARISMMATVELLVYSVISRDK